MKGLAFVLFAFLILFVSACQKTEIQTGQDPISYIEKHYTKVIENNGDVVYIAPNGSKVRIHNREDNDNYSSSKNIEPPYYNLKLEIDENGQPFCNKKGRNCHDNGNGTFDVRRLPPGVN